MSYQYIFRTGVNSRKKMGRYAFTLTEIAIVLGIFGLILSAIWISAARVQANQRVARAVNDTVTIVTGVRNIYAKQPTIPGTIVTQKMIDMGVYPANMLQPTCPGTGAYPYDSAVSPCPVDAWSHGAVHIAMGYANWFGSPAGPNDLTVMYWDDTMTDCPAFMAQILKTAGTSGLFWAAANNGTLVITNPLTAQPTDVANCTGKVTLSYHL